MLHNKKAVSIAIVAVLILSNTILGMSKRNVSKKSPGKPSKVWLRNPREYNPKNAKKEDSSDEIDYVNLYDVIINNNQYCQTVLTEELNEFAEKKKNKKEKKLDKVKNCCSKVGICFGTALLGYSCIAQFCETIYALNN